MNRQIEILAPAGSYEGMKAAMNAGCDAVYIGGSSFGARAYANNLDEDTLLKAIDEAHIRGKKLYLTVNTLLKEKELTTDLYRFLYRFYLQGLDAVIVQDVGVMNFIHENFPKLPIHASTQMTLTMAQGANILKDSGVTRLVTSRELSLKEIKQIRQGTDLEIETFVHGALCYCYSGQCLMSSLIGGRSGNRGRCAQPCRMPYQFYSEDQRISNDKEKYLLSPKDINTIPLIPELVESGIDSFKIEGRMKRPEYAAAVAYLYRKYVDLYLALGKEQYDNHLRSDELKKDMILLQDVYNRGGFSEGYGKTYHGKEMMSLYRPNHSGVYVGEVKEIKGSQVSIAVKEQINAQDILEIRLKEEDGYEFTVKDPHRPGDLLRTNVGIRPDKVDKSPKKNGNRAAMVSIPAIKVGAQVYRTKNNELLEQLENEYMTKDRKLGIQGFLVAKLGERLSLTASYGECSVTAYQDNVQEAMKQPMTSEKLRVPLEKTGDTLYYFEELHIEADENIFVPVAWLNDIRREVIQLLQQEIVKLYRRELIRNPEEVKQLYIANGKTNVDKVSDTTDNLVAAQRTGICAAYQTWEQYQILLYTPEVKAIHADYEAFTLEDILRMAKESAELNKGFYLSLTHICRASVYDRLKKDLNGIIEMEEIIGFIVKNLEEVSLLESLRINEKPEKEIILNSNMYTMNTEAKRFWHKRGITHYTAPIELNYQELKALGVHDSDLVVYGYLPLMISTQCLFESTQGCKYKKTGKGTSKENGFHGQMTDRLGKSFYVTTNCKSCYNIIYNGQPLALHKQANEIAGLNPRNIRLDFTKETAAQTKQVVTLFVDRYYNNKENQVELTEYTTGHYKRGVE